MWKRVAQTIASILLPQVVEEMLGMLERILKLDINGDGVIGKVNDESNDDNGD